MKRRPFCVPSHKRLSRSHISFELVESLCGGHRCVPSPLVGEG
jgi:hypothetical protein